MKLQNRPLVYINCFVLFTFEYFWFAEFALCMLVVKRLHSLGGERTFIRMCLTLVHTTALQRKTEGERESTLSDKPKFCMSFPCSLADIGFVDDEQMLSPFSVSVTGELHNQRNGNGKCYTCFIRPNEEGFGFLFQSIFMCAMQRYSYSDERIRNASLLTTSFTQSLSP